MQLTPICSTHNNLGFERIFDHLERALNNSKPLPDKYPPHNIIKTDVNRYVVEIAVAGFTKDDIEIIVENDNLEVKGSKIEKESTVKYVHRGIATRSFTKIIQLADTIEVREASLQGGILTIELENVVPEHKKPKRIEIKTSSDDKSQLLKG